MEMQYTPYMIPLVVSAVLSLAVGLFAWRRRSTAGAIPFVLLSLAVAEWSLGNALELTGTNVATKALWSRLEYLGVVFIPVLYLAFALQYTGREKWVNRRNALLLSLVPLVTLLLLWSNDLHHWFWVGLSLGGGDPFYVLAPVYGWAFWLHAAYDYLLLAIGTVILFRTLLRSPHLYRAQIGALLVAALAPVLGNVIYLAGLSPIPNLDLTPFAFTITNLALALGFFRFRLLDIVPVAREAVIESMGDALLVLDAKNRIVDLNPAAQAIMGRPAAEIIGRPVEQALSSWANLIERYRDVSQIQDEIVLEQGEDIRHYDLRISPLYDRQEHLTGRLIVLRDIGERKRAEAALQQVHRNLEKRNQQLAQILDTGNSLRLNLDPDALLQQIVLAAHRSLGFGVVVLSLIDRDSGQVRVRAHIGLDEEGREQMDGAVYMTWAEFSKVWQERFRVGRSYFIPEGEFDWERSVDGLSLGLSRREEFPVEKGGDWQANDALLVPIELRQGEVIGVISLDRPQDDRRPDEEMFQMLEILSNQAAATIENARLYNQLQQQLTERERAAAELQRAKDAAESANRAKTTFLANMSHELRTPLSAIIGYSELLQEEIQERGDQDLIPDLVKIRTAGSQLLSIISDILDLSKIEAGRMELHLESFDLRLLIDHVITTSRPLAEKNGNRIHLDYAQDIGEMHADQLKVRQILLNLLSNAAKFTHEGTITLSVSRAAPPPSTAPVTRPVKETDWICFRVTDTGIGMTVEQQQHIFKAFIQADASTTRKFGGTGLGLAISQRFCQMMGGTISVDSQVDQGSTFAVYLPAFVSPPSLPGALDRTQLPGSEEPVTATGPCQVLIIDDDPAARDLLSRYLGRHGFHVLTAADGPEGLRLARELHPGAIILDVRMPIMDGWDVLTVLKADPHLRDVPVIMVTIEDARQKGFALGASEYITKPIDREQLLYVLQKYHRPAGRILIIEDNDASRELLRRILERDGWSAVEAANGRVALMRVAEQQPDLILLDLMMPEMDGFDFLAELRKNPDWHEIPIFVITAKKIDAADRERLNGYVERILEKGTYRLEDLLGQIRDLLMSHVRQGEKSR